jgi:trigger factor
MNIAVEDIAPCRKRLKIEIPANRVTEELDRVTTGFQKEARIPGFRAGKAPKGMVEKRFAKEIEEELKRVLVPQAYRDAVKSKSLRVVSAPQIEDLNYQKGLSLSFSTVVELAPEFPLPDYKSIQVAKESPAEVTDADIQEVVDQMLGQFADYKTVEGRDLQEGDFAIVDYTGHVGGQPIAEAVKDAGSLAAAKGFWLWIKPDTFIPGFAAAMIGAKAGETRTIEVTFPEDFGHGDLKGKQTSYTVSVHEIKERILPELNDAFAQEHFKSDVPELRENIRKDIVRQREQEIRSRQTGQILDALRAMAKFDLPDSLVQEETRRLVYDIVQENQARGIPQERLEEKKSEIFANAKSGAEDRVKLGFLLARIAEAEKIEVSRDELGREIALMAARYQTTPQKVLEQLQENQALGRIEEQILNRKTVEFLLQNAIKE